MRRETWQFWIDVGGTFTDCLARRADGELMRCKVLSSGATKGSVAAGSTRETFVDPTRTGDPPDFWVGYELRLLADEGQVTARSHVKAFDPSSARLELDSPLEFEPREHQAYELTADDGAPLLAIRSVLGLRLDDPLPPMQVRLGTTRGTNALLTRRGAKTAFVTTRGFADVLRIGYQNRPKLFALAICKAPPLYAEAVEINERLAADGTILERLDEEQAREQLVRLRDSGIESLAICLLNAYKNSSHEQTLERIARDLGFDEISRSSDVAPLVKVVSRGDTTVVDAYLTPVLRSYVAGLREKLGPHSTLHLLTSAGGLVEADHFRGKDSILSGPAGGVVGFSRAAENAGFARAIGFDMGGTSTDVSRYDGRFELEYETEKAGVRVVAPMMAIETVAAGGGSICWFDGVKLAVGPDSAGADPGPACYGRGGPLAVTDLNYLLGRIRDEHFPFPLDRRAVDARMRETKEAIRESTGRSYEMHELAEGFLRIANANMANAIRSISIAKGYDPREYVLVAFGGAAPQHACSVARELGMRHVLIHSDASVLSALGIGLADVVRHRAAGIYQPVPDRDKFPREQIEAEFQELTEPATREVLAEGIPKERINTTRSLDLRYQKTDAALTIAEPEDGNWNDAFERDHDRLYGYTHAGRPLEIVAARVEVVGRSEQRLTANTTSEPSRPEPASIVAGWFNGRPCEMQLVRRDSLACGDKIPGPAVIVEALSTTFVEPGWRATKLQGGELLLEADIAEVLNPIGAATDVDQPDPVLLEIFNNQFATIAEQMGVTLRKTSTSVNVKERLDFSCAIFNASGDLVVNAPHIPVHLGAMSETVRRIIADNPKMTSGDVFVTNDPYRGGSHLPDITVVTPVYEGVTERPLFFTASRAHHAEIGGITPGSMPPFSKSLAEEGVLIRNFRLMERGVARWDELRKLLTTGEYPTRSVEDNLADIAAQVAANRQGARVLLQLVERFSLPVVAAYMAHIQSAAELKLRAALQRLGSGEYSFTDHLDDGSPIATRITIDGDRATIDFIGTGPVLTGNLNANRAIVTAAVMYVLRCMIDEDIPLNQGVLAPVTIVLPECLLSPPARENARECAAVVGGNVETSQRIVDVLLGAFGLAAASQGTMNNVLFGDASFGYYETICGGAGATPSADGADAVHTHMTNTRLTDPEVLEQRFPVMVREFRIRRGSGGAGRHRGGDGVVRRLEFRRPLELSILSQRRGPYPPYGMNGGESGAIGRQTIRRMDGSVEQLSALAKVQVSPGDILTIETPGGGGFGEPIQAVSTSDSTGKSPPR